MAVEIEHNKKSNKEDDKNITFLPIYQTFSSSSSPYVEVYIGKLKTDIDYAAVFIKFLSIVHGNMRPSMQTLVQSVIYYPE